MREKLPLPAGRVSSFLRNYSDTRLIGIFERVRRFVSTRVRGFSRAKLRLDCREILLFRRTHRGYLGDRAIMHAGHGGSICSIRWAAGLSDTTLVSMFLHEFGHLAGNDGEPEANAWVLEKFGIRIEYKGPLDLQWIKPALARRILARHSSS